MSHLLSSWLVDRRLLMGIPVIATILVYFQCIDFDFVTFDDGSYYSSYKPIQDITFRNITEIFSTFHKGNYHPLTTLTWMFEYAVVGDNASLLHFNNVLLHLFNPCFAFLFIERLFGNRVTAFSAALLFGIHPMHVESVAWISERKDVLYTCFFLSSMLLYLRYRDHRGIRFLHWSFGLFILSCLSKSAAVVLPVVLVLIDYLEEKGPKVKHVTGKIHFFAVSFLFGIVAIFSQDSSGAIQDVSPFFNSIDRIFLVCFSVCSYLYKAIIPLDLVCFYPYPAKVAGSFDWYIYISPLILLLITFLVIRSMRASRGLAFVFLFFLSTIALVLQILPVGGAFVADRYTYMPYLALFILPGFGLEWMKSHKSTLLVGARGLMLIYAIVMAFLCYGQVKTWKDSETLWTNVINHAPSEMAYNNRGYHYNQEERYAEAVADIDRCLQFNPDYQKAYNNRGLANYHLGNYQQALTDLTKAIELDSTDPGAYLSRGNVYSKLGEYGRSINDYNAYMLRDQQNHEAFFWRGTAFYKLTRYTDAISDHTKSATIDPSYFDAWFWRGSTYLDMRDPANAITDFDMCIRLRPTDGVSYYNRSLGHYRVNNFVAAQQDANQARQLGYEVHPQYFQILEQKLAL